MTAINSHVEDRHAWGYLQNALAVVTELTMLHSELFAVQAILGMAIILQGTPNPQPCSVLIFAAIKLAQSMNLHRREQEPGLSVAEIEQRKRVFWIAYLLDKDVSLRTGQPPAQDDEEMDAQLPIETVDLDSVGDQPINFLNLRIGLAIIQGQIYKRLCSIKALRQSERERSVVAKQLEDMLYEWKRSAPIDFGSHGSSSSLSVADFPTLLHTIILRFTYFNALSTIHRFLFPGFHLDVSSSEPIAQLQQSGNNLIMKVMCVDEARNSVRLLQKMRQGDYAYVWLCLHVYVSACAIILLHVISDVNDPHASEDLKLVQPLLRLIKTLGKDRVNFDVRKMDELLTSLWNHATVRVDTSRENGKKVINSRHSVSIGNGNKEKRESLEEFISRIERISAGLTEGDDDISPSTSWGL